MINRRNFLRAGAVAAAAAPLSGCFVWKKIFGDDDDDKIKYLWSPEGYPVLWQEQGSTTNGLITMAEIYELHAKGVEQGIDYLNRRYGLDKGTGQAHAVNEIGWHLIDNCCFIASDNRTWAAGEYIPRSDRNIIQTGLYRREPPQAGVGLPCADMPADVPPWTVNHNPANHSECRWGVLDKDRPFPSIGHEMGHHFWGPRFEHGWQPPIVNGAPPMDVTAAHNCCGEHVGY
jgi:hypothetical protein